MSNPIDLSAIMLLIDGQTRIALNLFLLLGNYSKEEEEAIVNELVTTGRCVRYPGTRREYLVEVIKD